MPVVRLICFVVARLRFGFLFSLGGDLARDNQHVHDKRKPSQVKWPTQAFHRTGFEELEQLIDDKKIFIAFYEIADELYAMTVDHEARLQTIPLEAHLSEIAQTWAHVQMRIKQPGRGIRPLQRRLASLWTQLIEPLLPQLISKQQLIIAPCDSLFHLPFAMLYDRLNNRYLCERWVVNYVPSATILAHCQQQPAGTDDPLLLGYAGEPTQRTYLPAVETEIATLHRLFPAATTLTGDAATYDDLLRALPNRPIVHIAGHIVYDLQNPLASGIPLTNGRWLRAADLYLQLQQWRGTTVVLSGCESGIDQPMGGDFLGLTNAFLYAGAKGVMATLWPVDDTATAKLMGNLYTALRKGHDFAHALQQAQKRFLKDEQYAHPYYWAGFVFCGASLSTN